MSKQPVFAYARLNIRVPPIDRGEQFEDPLEKALADSGLGEVTGGGTMQSRDGEIEYCGIDLDLYDLGQGVPFVCQFLTNCGAPRGSKLRYEVSGKQVESPFGSREGLAIYFNGTDLPAEVYRQCDINEVYDELNHLLRGKGAIYGHWQGPTETALYLYGNSVNEMNDLIADYLATYPLCQRARLVTIA